MQIIPVLDIMDGQVVSALQGKRETYQPVRSKLSSCSLIQSVLTGLLKIFPFQTIYIADLNAIIDSGNNIQLIKQTISDYPTIQFWVDSGKLNWYRQLCTTDNYKPILGSESIKTLANTAIEKKRLTKAILSLDFDAEDNFLGPSELLEQFDLWPQQIIIMTLACVGKKSGPDLKKLQSFCQKYPEKNFIAAGGIRHQMDLIQLQKIGINHALLASALHSGEINKEIIKSLQNFS